jgi:hypothetical protein
VGGPSRPEHFFLLPQQSLSETEPVQVCTDLFLFEGLAAYRKQARRESIGFLFHQEPEPVVCTLNLGY